VNGLTVGIQLIGVRGQPAVVLVVGDTVVVVVVVTGVPLAVLVVVRLVGVGDVRAVVQVVLVSVLVDVLVAVALVAHAVIVGIHLVAHLRGDRVRLDIGTEVHYIPCDSASLAICHSPRFPQDFITRRLLLQLKSLSLVSVTLPSSICPKSVIGFHLLPIKEVHSTRLTMLTAEPRLALALRS